jgi:hypothetical protein
MKISTIALLAAAGLSLAACGHKEEEAAPDANLTNITVPEDATVNVSTETPVAAPTGNTVEATPAAPVELAPEAQTQDDADATGMTARVSRDEGNESGQPVQ